MYKPFLLLLISVLFSVLVKSQDLPIVLEVESGNVGSDFNVVNNNDITYVTPSTDYVNSSCPGNETKVITFDVSFAAIGNYDLYVKARVGSNAYGDDSFYFSKSFGSVSSSESDKWYTVNGIVNAGYNVSTDVVDGGESVGTLEWKWINVSEYLNSENPVLFRVDNVTNSLNFSIGSRENGLDIDKIAFGNADLFYTVENLELVSAGSIESNSDGFPDAAYQQVKTFVNPVLSGDHADQTLMRDGGDFYTAGSSFHFNPYIPIYHSTDLVHWEIVSRVVPSNNWGVTDSPSAGVWQGALAKFGGYYWIYYSINSTQYFSKSSSMDGNWSSPVKVTGTTVTGYDNSIFVDDDGVPYMLMKNGKNVNRIQQVDTLTGQLTGSLINCDFINEEGTYSWAEGPTMCKRNGWYYYFIAGNVGGGQYVLRTDSLSDIEDDWEPLGDFFASITDDDATFRAPNHVSQPIQLDDGTWWAVSHSYENKNGDDWSGQGRQGLLHPVVWSLDGKPTGKAPISTPQLAPNLPQSDIPWSLPRSDYFSDNDLDLAWHFLDQSAATNYSLSKKSGWLTLSPGMGTTHILQKEGGHYNAIVTKINVNATSAGEEAGIYLTNGNESITSEIYSGYNGAKVLGFRFNGTTIEIVNPLGNELWLKAERNEHYLSAYYSSNGITWDLIGDTVASTVLDGSQDNYNWWVGTSDGLYANGIQADFDLFVDKDGFSPLPIVGYNNYFGLKRFESGLSESMVNTSDKGGWAMLGGVDLGFADRVPALVQIEASAIEAGQIEIWIDDLENNGTRIATINVGLTESTSSFQNFSANVTGLSGQHDVFLRWSGAANSIQVKTIQFIPDDSYLSAIHDVRYEKNWSLYPNPFCDSFTLENDAIGSIYRLYAIDGKVAESGVLNSNKQNLGAHLQEGSYIFVSDGQKIKVNKLNR